MNNLKRIEKLRELEEEKKEFEKMLNLVNIEIGLVSDRCSHVGVFLNFVTFNCVICKQKIDPDEYPKLNEQGLIIDACGYLTELKDDQERLDNIQTMYLGFCRQYPEKTDTEIVKMFNQMIQVVVNNNSESDKEERDPKSLKRTD